MKQTTLAGLSCALCAALSTNAMAVDDRQWTGHASVGATISSGNTDHRRLLASAELARKLGDNAHRFSAGIYQAESDDESVADRSELTYQLNRHIDPSVYWLARLRYETDDFANIDGRSIINIGLGGKLLQHERQSLSAEGGIGWAHAGYNSLDPDGDGNDDLNTLDASGTSVYASLAYHFQISTQLNFTSRFRGDYSINETAAWDNHLNYRLSERLSVSVGYLLRTTDVTGARGDKQDSTTMLSLNYGL